MAAFLKENGVQVIALALVLYGFFNLHSTRSGKNESQESSQLAGRRGNRRGAPVSGSERPDDPQHHAPGGVARQVGPDVPHAFPKSVPPYERMN